MTGTKEQILAKLKRAIDLIEAGATPFQRERCGECGRDFDSLEDLEAHEAELDGK